MNESAFPSLRLVVSKCLGFDNCRYDGSIVPSPVVAALRDWADFIPVCPEMEIGLGAPRPPIRIVQAPQGPRLLQPATGRDLTDAMQAFATSFLDALPPVDGFVLKNRSPSCGLKDAKVHASAEKGPSVGMRAGFFGGVVVARFPDLPAEDEGRLTNRALREHFFAAVFALARLREAVGTGQMGALVDFHTRHKFLLMAYNQARLRELGRVVANLQRRPTGEVMEAYVAGFRAALARPPRRPSVVNVLMHALGYVSDGLSPAEKGYFLDLLTAYREGRVPPQRTAERSAGLGPALRGAVPLRADLLLAVPGGAPFPPGLGERRILKESDCVPTKVALLACGQRSAYADQGRRRRPTSGTTCPERLISNQRKMREVLS